MKKILSAILCVAVLLSSMCITFAADESSAWDGTIATAFAGGDGTAENPYQISNGAELAYFASLVNNATDENRTQVTGTEFQVDESTTGILNAPYVEHYLAYTDVHFVLTSDIDFGNQSWIPVGNIDGDVKNLFNGTFDGGEHVIKNVKIDANYQFVGFFGAIGRNAVIKNVGIDGASYSYTNDKTNAAIGGMVGFITGGTITNSFVRNLDINITGNKATGIGGLFGVGFSAQFGVKSYAAITDCYTNNIVVTAENIRGETGGIFGRLLKNPWWAQDAAFPGNAYLNDSATKIEQGHWNEEENSALVYTFSNVYAGDFESVGAEEFYSFGCNNTDNTLPVINCYAATTSASNTTNLVTTASAKADIVSQLVIKDGAFAEDNAKEAINEGYPVLAWEVNWDNNVASSYAGGTGTEADPYLISNAAELMYFASMVNNATDDIRTQMQGAPNKDGEGNILGYYNPSYNPDMYWVYTGVYFKLTNDIDLAGLEWNPIGSNDVNFFNGTFDGDGHIVKNITITEDHAKIGLFGATGKDVTVKNLGIENFSYEYFNSGDLELSDEDQARAAGGMVGTVSGGKFENCFVRNGEIINKLSAVRTVGGFAGASHGAQHNYKITATFTNCYVNDVKLTEFTNGSSMSAFLGNGYTWGLYKKADYPPEDAYFNPTLLIKDDGGTWYNDGWFMVYTKISNCYASNVDFAVTMEGVNVNYYSFAEDYADTITSENSYTTMTDKNNDGNTMYSEITTSSTQADIINAIVSQTSGYSMDEASLNGGYPVLNWESERLLWNGSAADGYAGGTGTETDPYLISNAAELLYFANMVNNATDDIKTEVSSDTNPVYTPHSLVYTGKWFKLTNDIDLGGIEWTPIGNAASRFDGVFDGNGHIIKNAKISECYYLIGFFGYTGTNVTLKNLGVEELTINFHNNTDGIWVGAAGVMVGAISGGNIENCYTKNSFIKNTSGITRGIGGFVGGILPGQIETHPEINIKNCYTNNIRIEAGDDFVGGFIGNMSGDCLDLNTAGTPCPAVTNGQITSQMYFEYWRSESNINIENCYAGNVTFEDYNVNDYHFYFAFGRSHCSWTGLWTVNNCYSVATTDNPDVYGTYQENKYGDPASVKEAASAEDMLTGLVADGTAFKADPNSINGGYPILSWESGEAELVEMNIYGIDVANGKVTGVTLENYAAVDGDKLVIVVYENGKLSAVGSKDITDEAVSAYQTIALTEALTVPSGATIKAFIWDENMQPLCNSLEK